MLNKAGISDNILKPEQVKCFQYVLERYGVIAVIRKTAASRYIAHKPIFSVRDQMGAR